MGSPVNIHITLPGHLVSKVVAPDGTIKFFDQVVVASGVDKHRDGTIRTIRNSNGWRPPTPWKMHLTEFSNPYIDREQVLSNGTSITDSGDADIISAYSLTIHLPSAAEMSTLSDLAINNALLKLSNQQTDLGENFAEREQADRMIGERIDRYTSQLTGRYISKHRRDWRTVKRVSPFIRHGLKYPESWLEFQYGVVPLLSDIFGAFNVLKNVDKDYGTFRTTVKGFKALDDLTQSVTLNASPSYTGLSPAYRGTVDWVTTRSAFVFVRLDYSMVNPALVQLQRLSLVNPALLAWNLLPYSFVVDWALPVGDYLQAWTADLGWQFMGGSITSVQKVDAKFQNAKPGPTNSSVRSNHLTVTPVGPNKLFWMDRLVFASSPAPRLPHFKNPLSLGHTANALSLLVTALAKS